MKLNGLNSLRGLKDLVYPVLCYQCGELEANGYYLCQQCFDAFKKVGDDGENFCASCSEPFEGRFSENPTCRNCNTLDYSFEFGRSALKNSDTARALVHDFKYRKQRHLAGVLADFCQQAMEMDERITNLLETSKDETVIVPVPLHWRRHLYRGFNQAELISKVLAEQLGIRHMKLIKRKRYTTTQTRLARHERLKNLKDAFSIHRKHSGKDDFKQVILIDDVFTTGSTSEACASLLKKDYAKVENIVVVTVLRG